MAERVGWAGWASAAAVLAGACGAASGQLTGWRVTDLGPVGTTFSEAYDVSSGRVGGQVSNRAAWWDGGFGSAWVDLHPAGVYTRSAVNSLDATQQGGSVSTSSSASTRRAALWSGSAASFVELQPAGATSSSVWAVRGGRQVGTAVIGGSEHAGMWSGTAGSWLDLHPAGSTTSFAAAIDGNTVGGHTTGSLQATWPSAVLWTGVGTGTPGIVSLHPAGTSASSVTSIAGAVQAGVVYYPTWPPFGSLAPEACVWSGTAGSFVNLNPVSATRSVVTDCGGAYQVGWYSTDYSNTLACYWMGTRASFQDLSQLLPAGWSGGSGAAGVWVDRGGVYIAGWAQSPSGRHAVMWEKPQCGTSDFDGDGVRSDRDIEAFFACLRGDCCAACYPRGADFNADGDVGTDADIESFFRVLAGGAC